MLDPLETATVTGPFYNFSNQNIGKKNLVISIQSNVYCPCKFCGFSSSKVTVPCSVAHLGSFVAPQTEYQPASEMLRFSYKSTTDKEQKETV
jgi:hypothetical protein